MHHFNTTPKSKYFLQRIVKCTKAVNKTKNKDFSNFTENLPEFTLCIFLHLISICQICEHYTYIASFKVKL